jgi:LPS-assembly protein
MPDPADAPPATAQEPVVAPSPPPLADSSAPLRPTPRPVPIEPPPPPLLPSPREPAAVPRRLSEQAPVVELEGQDLSGESPWVLPPRESAMPAPSTPATDAVLGPLPRSSARDDDAVLHADLPWDFCGPRIGGTGIGGGVAQPEMMSDRPVDVDADQALYDRAADQIELIGGVEFQQGEQRLTADRTLYQRGTGEVDAAGNLFVSYPGARLRADAGRYNLESGEGRLEGVRYRFAGDANLRGSAEIAELLTGERTRYRDVIYTTCPPGQMDWSLRASDLLLDHDEGLGTARHARIRLAGVPVLYSPYLRFPIDDRRRSGFLIPSVGNSDRTGFDLTIPYYWNIAPNMDATFFPRYMSTRGLMLGAEVRHLNRFQDVKLTGDVLPNDSAAPELGTRWAGRIEQRGRFGKGWSSTVDASAVSDDGVLSDFGNRLDVTSSRNLRRRGELAYRRPGLTARGWLQGFQTIDPLLPERSYPYAQLPHLEAELRPWRQNGLVDVGIEGRYDYFDHPVRVDGSRVVMVPSVSVPMRRSFGDLTPRARLFYTGYQLTDVEEGVDPHQSHLIPSLDVDGRLIFERDMSWFGASALQTLEPRLYYVLTSYEDQSDTPLFDTTTQNFGFASLFRPNRFTGYDRLGDENRLTVALTSRTLGALDGSELFRASIGQVLFFKDRLVQLTGDTIEDDATSAIAGELSAALGKGLIGRASAQWNPNADEDEVAWEQRVLELRYAPGDERILNLAYRFNEGATEATSYENTDLAFRLPVTPQVQLVGRWLYSLLNEETVDAFAGIEFGRCCWRVRLVGRHLKTSGVDGGNTSVMLQLELAGLGAFGNSIDKLLEEGIYGYGAY